MRRGKLGFHESEDLSGGRNLLRLGRLLDEIRCETGLELRQPGILRRNREQFLNQFQGLVETAGFRKRFDRPFEHRKAMDGPRVEGHQRGMAGEDDMPLPSGSAQYRGISGSTFSAHSSIPPTRFLTLRKPSSRRKFVMRAERTPVLQYTTISSAVLSSFTREGTWATGIRTALSRRAISHSIGSRTSSRTGSVPASIFSFNSATVIWRPSPTFSDAARSPQNSS